MALEPKINFCLKNDGIHIFDTTGRYDSEENETGWGTPNIEYNEVVSAVLDIKNINTGQGFTIDNFFNIFETPKEIIEFGPFDYKFDDGIIEVEYTIEDSAENVYNACISKFYMRNIDCCIDTLIYESLSNEDPQFIKTIQIADAQRKALKLSAMCMNLDVLEKKLKLLKTICNNCPEMDKNKKYCKSCATVK